MTIEGQDLASASAKDLAGEGNVAAAALDVVEIDRTGSRVDVASEWHGNPIDGSIADASNGVAVTINQGAGLAWIEARIHRQAKGRCAALDQAINVEIKCRDGNIAAGEDGSSFGVCCRTNCRRRLSFAGWRPVSAIAVVSGGKGLGAIGVVVQVLARVGTSVEPGVTIKGEVANRSDIKCLSTQLARDDHTIGCIRDRNGTGFIDHRTGEIKIWRGCVGGVPGW